MPKFEKEIHTTDQLNEISALRDHVIICGLHNLGMRIFDQLHAAGVPAVIVDDTPDPRFVRRVRRMGAIFIEDDSRLPETLLEAGIQHASAVIACEESDLHNLEIVMLANELVEGIRAVASFFNQRVGEQLTAAIPNATALSLSEKAGPSFAEACSNSSVLHLFNIDNEEVVVMEAEVREAAQISQLYGKIRPLLVRDKPSQPPLLTFSNGVPNVARRIPTEKDWELYPPPDYLLQPEQSVILTGRAETLRKLPGVTLREQDIIEAQTRLQAIDTHNVGPTRSPWQTLAERRARRRRRLAGIRQFVSNLFSDIERPFRYALLFVGLVIVLSTLILWVFYRSTITTDAFGRPEEFTLVDALYFTLTVIATVGFGDYGFAQQDLWLKLYGILLIILGTASVSVIYAFVTNFIVSRRIEQTLGRQRATDMENHIVLCGMGSVGYQVLRGLVRQGRSVVVIEKSENGRFLSEARNLAVPVIMGDSRLPRVLKAANIHKAQTLIALTNDDLANLETGLNAHAEFHSLESNRNGRLQVVLRVFDGNLADRVARNFDIHSIYSASALVAPYFVGAALNYEVVSTFYLNRRPFVVVRLNVQENSSLAERSVQEFYEATGMWLLAYLPAPKETIQNIYVPLEHLQVRQLSPDFHPSPDVKIKGGDTIYFIGPTERIIMAYRMNRKG